MIKDLPPECRLNATTFDPETLRRPEGKSDQGFDPDSINWFYERRIWDKSEMKMLAVIANLLGELRTYVPQWQKKPPPFDPVGPAEWRHPELTKTTQPATVMDVMRVFGYQGDSQEESSTTVEDAMRALGYQGDSAQE